MTLTNISVNLQKYPQSGRIIVTVSGISYFFPPNYHCCCCFSFSFFMLSLHLSTIFFPFFLLFSTFVLNTFSRHFSLRFPSPFPFLARSTRPPQSFLAKPHRHYSRCTRCSLRVRTSCHKALWICIAQHDRGSIGRFDRASYLSVPFFFLPFSFFFFFFLCSGRREGKHRAYVRDRSSFYRRVIYLGSSSGIGYRATMYHDRSSSSLSSTRVNASQAPKGNWKRKKKGKTKEKKRKEKQREREWRHPIDKLVDFYVIFLLG